MTYPQIKLFSYLVLAVFFLFFFAQNSDSKADFHFYGVSFHNIPVLILMLLSFCAGILFWIVFNYTFLQNKKNKKNENNENNEKEKDIKKTKRITK